MATVNSCMDAYGNIINFPAGSYNEQISTEEGETELGLMRLMWDWRRIIFLHKKGKIEGDDYTRYSELIQWEFSQDQHK